MNAPTEPTVTPNESVSPESMFGATEPANPEPMETSTESVNSESMFGPTEPTGPELMSTPTETASPEPMTTSTEPVNSEPMATPTETANPEPTIQSFNNNPGIQSFDNNVANQGMPANTAQNSGAKNNKIIIIVAAIVVVAIAVAVLLIPNLGKKTVTCSQEQSQTGIKIKSEITTDFKGNKVDVITIKGTYTVEDTYKDYIDLFYDSVKEQVKEFEKTDGVKGTSEKKGNVVTFTVTANRSSAEKLFETQFNGEDETPEAFIKAAKEQGMTCTK